MTVTINGLGPITGSDRIGPDGLGLTGINGGQIAGLRNRIINGGMNVAQRGTSFAAANGYTLDRWLYGSVGTAVATVTQQADAPSSNEFQNSLRVAVTTADASIAAGDVAGVSTRLEGYNVRDLIGKTFTLSFWVRSSKTGTHCVSFSNNASGTPDRSYISEYTVSAANTWEQKSITVSGGLITAGTWDWTNGGGLRVYFAMAAGSTFQTTAGAWNTGNFFATSSQVNCLDTIGNIFAITGVQLELGSTATTFEQRPYGMELALCQRYYVRLNSIWSNMYAYNTTSCWGKLADLPVTMRATPTGGLSNIGHFRPTVGGSNAPAFTGGAVDNVSVSHIGTGGWTGSSGLTLGGGSIIHLVTPGTGWVDASAEL